MFPEKAYDEFGFEFVEIRLLFQTQTFIGIYSDRSHFYCCENKNHEDGSFLEKGSSLTEWPTCVFEEPKKETIKVVMWKNIWDVPKHLWCNVLFKKANEPVCFAKVLYPAAVADSRGNIIDGLVYLPQNSKLEDKWFKMEHCLLPDGTTLLTLTINHF